MAQRKPCPRCGEPLHRWQKGEVVGWTHLYAFGHALAGKPMCDYSEREEVGPAVR